MRDAINTNYFHVRPPSVARSAFAVMEIMDADISNHIPLKDLARNVCTNECTLKKTFKYIFKITVYQYLLKRRMVYAENLLQTTSLLERDIALLCGYQSLAGFITSFRKYFGYSPGEFKRRLSSDEL